MFIFYRILLPVMDINGKPDEPECHDTVGHCPANVVGVLVQGKIANHQVAQLEHK